MSSLFEYLSQLKLGKVPPAVMGIVNLTPDSFSGDGVYTSSSNTLDQIIAKCDQMVKDGARILDIGGESTKPSAAMVSAEEESNRILPVFKALKNRYQDIWLSIDSYKPEIAALALSHGCHILNDIKGGEDPAMLGLCKQFKVPIILMHNRAKANKITNDLNSKTTSYEAPHYHNFMEEIQQDLRQLAHRASQSGLEAKQIILDPGIGFGKTTEQNLLLVKEIESLCQLGYPLLIGASRKSFIGKVLNKELPQERLYGSFAINLLAAEFGASIIRVHDVKETMEMITMQQAVKNAQSA